MSGSAYDVLKWFGKEMMLKVKVKVAQLRPILCDPMEFSRPEYRSG